MRKLQGFSDAGTPGLRLPRPGDAGADRSDPQPRPLHLRLDGRAEVARQRRRSLGPDLPQPPTRSSRRRAPWRAPGASPTTKLAKLLVSTEKTKGFDRLVDLIYNGTGATNEFDKYGHLIRSLVTLTDCAEYCIIAEERLQSDLRQRRPGLGLRLAAVYERIQEELAEQSGGTAATLARARAPSSTPRPPAEPTPELGEGAGRSEPAKDESAGARSGSEERRSSRAAKGARIAPSAPQRALLDYLLGP